MKHYTKSIGSLGRASKVVQALECLKEMRHKGLKPNTITYNAAISACEKGQRWERALDLLGEMRRGVAPDVIG